MGGNMIYLLFAGNGKLRYVCIFLLAMWRIRNIYVA